MADTVTTIIKRNGEEAQFDAEKLEASLRRSGASAADIAAISATVQSELYPGISTNEIYNRAYGLLKKKKSVYASRYKLKKAIYELGPSGFPFEQFVGALMRHSGYEVEVGVICPGKCVSHEVDVVAENGTMTRYMECKFHSEKARKCDVKVPLYIHARFLDIQNAQGREDAAQSEGWVVTNTRFTSEAQTYGLCAGLKLWSWDFPKGDGLKDHIDYLGLYPITASSVLTKREKNFLLSRDVVLCKQLKQDKFYLDHLGISAGRKQRILSEMNYLCDGIKGTD